MDIDSYFDRVYENYDRYMAIPVALLLVAAVALGAVYMQKGKFLEKGSAFTGGTEVKYTVDGDFNSNDVETAFSEAGRPGVTALRQETTNQTYLIVQVPPPVINSTEEAERLVEVAGYDATVESFNSISASVSEEFFLQAQLAFGLAFAVMSFVIFVAFRDLTPSLAVIFAAFSDIIFALAGMAVLGIPLTLGSLAALLMLIGYSVDTDIVLSSRVLKLERGSLKERIWSSVKTGTTMSMGGIAGFTLLYIVSYMIVGPSELGNIAAVMVIGLVADMPFTWFGNAIILKKYVEGDLGYERFRKVVPWT